MTERRQEKVQDLVDKAVKRDQQAAADFQKEFGADLKAIKNRYAEANEKVMELDLGMVADLLNNFAECDKLCVKRCTKVDAFNTAQEQLDGLPECIPRCGCEVDTVKLEVTDHSAYDYKMLARYNKNNQGAWASFMRNKAD